MRSFVRRTTRTIVLTGVAAVALGSSPASAGSPVPPTGPYTQGVTDTACAAAALCVVRSPHDPGT